MYKELTIVITTFNRRERLINQLRSIFKQPIYTRLEIIICDNCSDYDVKEMLDAQFSEHELAVVKTIRRPFNIGMVGNLSQAFLEAGTKWMWLLSDDDETTIDSIEKIFNKINEYPDAVALKFTKIDEIPKPNFGVKDVGNIEDFLRFCDVNKIRLGDFIFMSNNVYNMYSLKPYLGTAFIHAYTYFPHVMPLISALNDRKPIKFISDSIVTYKAPEVAASSDYFVSIYLGAITIADLPLNLDKNHFKALVKYFNMNLFWVVSNHFYQCTYLEKRLLYKKVYYGFYSHQWSLKNWMIFKLFSFQLYIGNNAISAFGEILKWGKKKVY